MLSKNISWKSSDDKSFLVISSCAYLHTSKTLHKLENLDKVSIAWKCSDEDIGLQIFFLFCQLVVSKSDSTGSSFPLKEPIIFGC